MIDCTCGISDRTPPLRGKTLRLVLIGTFVLAGCGARQESITRPEALDPPVSQSNPAPGIKTADPTPVPDSIKPRGDEEPIQARLSASPRRLRPGETLECSVVLNVAAPYEIHSLDALPPLFPTRLELELPSGFTVIDDWKSPVPDRSLLPDGQLAYRGEVKFVRTIRVSDDTEPGDYPLVCSVSYQACNSRHCLRPIKTSLKFTLSVAQ